MKKNILVTAIAAGLLSVTACKKETTTTTETTVDTLTTETTTVTTQETAVPSEFEQAKMNLAKAENDLQIAIKSGDKKAEVAALKVRDEAQASWDKIAAGVNNAANDVKDGINNAANKVEEGADKVGEKAKKVGKDVEEGYNKTLDKMKTNN